MMISNQPQRTTIWSHEESLHLGRQNIVSVLDSSDFEEDLLAAEISF